MTSGFVIFPGEDQWTIVRIQRDDCRVERASADSIAAVLRSLGYRRQRVMLALPSSWCLCATVEASGLRSRNLHAGLVFRLEEQLPLAIEEVVADFIVHKGKALGIAVQTERVHPIIASLVQEEIPIDTICPAALLCASGTSISDGAILCQSDNRLDLMRVENGTLVQWTHPSDDAEVLAIHLRQMALAGEQLAVHGIGLSDSLRHAISAIPKIELIVIEGDFLHWACRAAAGTLASTDPPPVQLCRGTLASRDRFAAVRQPLKAAIAAVIALCLSLSASMLWRAHRYDQLTDGALIRQQQAFHAALPSQPTPFSVTTRLLSEQKRLQGVSGSTSGTPQSPSVLPLVRDALACLPRDLRFRLLDLRFEPRRLYLQGQALDHATADQIAAALRRGTRLSIDPPHTEQPLGEDVLFTLSGSTDSNSFSPTLAASDRQPGGLP